MKFKWNGWTLLWAITLLAGITIPFRGDFSGETFLCMFIWFCLYGPILALNLYLLNNPKCIANRIKRKEYKAQLRQERQKQAAERALKSAQEKIHQDKIKREQEAFKQKDNTPVKAKLIWDTVEVKSKFSLLGALSGATIFGLLTGGIGLLWGAMLGGDACGSTSAKYLALFAVEYATGRRGTEVVEINSSRFHLLTSCISLDQ